MRLGDLDSLREDWLENGENEYVYDTNSFLASIDEQPTIDPETLPVVQELREKVQTLQKKLDDWEYWMGYRKRIVDESARQDRAAVKVMQKRCEKIIAEMRQDLAKVTAERDAAQKLLAEHSGVAGCSIITTCFGYPMDKVRELIEADRAGLCVALPPRKLTEAEIMEAEKLNAKIGRIIDNAVVELFARKAAEAALKGENVE